MLKTTIAAADMMILIIIQREKTTPKSVKQYSMIKTY